MEARTKEEARQKLAQQITEWNGNRLDLFELSLPNEELEFHGVMRFYFHDPGSKVATKCIRVSSTATTRDVLDILIEKFRPDMRMLSLPSYSVYELHANGEERKLEDPERPLLVQLNWGKDDREGRFLLKSNTAISVPVQNVLNADQTAETGGFKRKLSKREKKEKKKKEKEAKLKGKENETPKESGTAESLYKELPDTSFTRSISNPEAVMRKRRQLKLEKKLQQIKSNDGGPDKGGTLKIYGESLRPDVPYKTLLLSASDNASFVVKETLEKYGMEKEDPDNYFLIQVMIPPPEQAGGRWKEYYLEDDDCPLAILLEHRPGTVMFHIKRRPADMPRKKKKSHPGSKDDPRIIPPERLPYLHEINPDGSEPYKARRIPLPMTVTEVGSNKEMVGSGQYILLYGPDIHPTHCVIAHTKDIVTVTPTNKSAETFINNQRVYETTMLQPGMVLRFGKNNIFRFHPPPVIEEPNRPPVVGVQQPSSPYDASPPVDTSNFETTFDVDGHIETVTGQDERGPQPMSPGRPATRGELLPATLEFRDEGEDAFLAAVISEVNGAVVQFKLSPTYTLYMAARNRLNKSHQLNMSPQDRANWNSSIQNKIAHMVQSTIQGNQYVAGALSFWMANASELLHFFKQDQGLSQYSGQAQDILAEAVQEAFTHLVDCMQAQLQNAMPAFLDPALDEVEEDDVLQVLAQAMSLLRRCRVNAALTIQLFSQLFHFINMWLFNKLVTEPHLQLCSRTWGHRLKRRLGRVEIWAEKQGLELAADCHLARIVQAAHLLEAPKSSPDDIANVSSTCFKLNSMQLRALLMNYIPGPGEPHIPNDLIERVVSVAENTADELARSDGRNVWLEEEPDLQLPFLLPEDGYSCDIVKGVPSGLAEFIDPLSQTGICRMTMHPNAPGVWTVYMSGDDMPPLENLRQKEMGVGPPVKQDVIPVGLPREPEITNITFSKVKGSMGLSIVAAKGDGQSERGIYIKSVVPGGGAAQDGRLQAGDQLLEVDRQSLVGLTQEKAAELMTRTGQTVSLKVAKQGAIYHGLATLLSQPSPTMPRGSPQKAPGSAGKPGGNRPKSEDVSRYKGPGEGEASSERPHYGREPPQRLLGLPYGAAKSSPSLTSARSQEQLRDPDPYSSHRQPGPPGYFDPREAAMRSKSTSNLERVDDGMQQNYPRPSMSVSTLPRGVQPEPQRGNMAHHQHPQKYDMMNRPASQPDLNRRDENARMEPGLNYENYPQSRPQQPINQPHYMNQNEVRGHAQYPDQHDPRTHSLTTVPDDRGRADTMPVQSGRPRSEDLNSNRVREWQQRNELQQQRERQQWEQSQRQQQKPPEEAIPRSQPNAPGYYPGSPMRGPEPIQQDQIRSPARIEESRGRPVAPVKPPVSQKSGQPDGPPKGPPHGGPQGYYDPRQQYQSHPQHPESQRPAAHQGAPNYPPASQAHGYPPSSQPPHSQGFPTQQSYMPPQQHMPPSSQQNYQNIQQQTRYQSRTETRTTYGQPDQRKVSPTGKADMYDKRNESPELPPPPDLPPPPEDMPHYGEELPPPPPPPPNQEYEHDRMGHRMGPPRSHEHANHRQVNYRAEPIGEPYRQTKPGKIEPSKGKGQQYSNAAGDGARTGTQQPGYPPAQSDPRRSQSPPQPQYPYQPRPAPAAIDISSSDSRVKKAPPPIATKPKVGKAGSPSPWEREEKERMEKRKKVEMQMMRAEQIRDMENAPYLTPEEQEILKRLRLDHEFERRVQEVQDREEEEEEAISDRVGRVQVLQMMQENIQRKQEQLTEHRKQQEQEKSQAEQEKIERQERRLQQFEQEREEQRKRQMKQQEKRAREAEEYLNSQRELREKQRKELEEHQKKQRLEDERYREKQREELRKKKEQEQKQLREMQMARELEEKTLREAAKREEEEYARQRMQEIMQERDAQNRRDMERGERYRGLHTNDPAYRPSDPGPVPMSTSSSGGRYGPPPPERKSSYDVYKTSSSSYLPNNSMYDTSHSEMSQAHRSTSSSLLRQVESPAMAGKKSVSFDSNLAVEIREQGQYQAANTTSSTFTETYPYPNDPNYPYRGSSNEVDPTSPHQRPVYNSHEAGPPIPPSPAHNTVYEQRTPDNVHDPRTVMVTGPTPGVVGAQEIYRDPRDKIAAAKANYLNPKNPGPERMSFRDKMKMFATENGENTPKDKSKTSSVQRKIESEFNGQ